MPLMLPVTVAWRKLPIGLPKLQQHWLMQQRSNNYSFYAAGNIYFFIYPSLAIIRLENNPIKSFCFYVLQSYRKLQINENNACFSQYIFSSNYLWRRSALTARAVLGAFKVFIGFVNCPCVNPTIKGLWVQADKVEIYHKVMALNKLWRALATCLWHVLGYFPISLNEKWRGLVTHLWCVQGHLPIPLNERWRGRDLNPRPRAYESPALPLSYLAITAGIFYPSPILLSIEIDKRMPDAHFTRVASL